jgi:hypothetical protein
VSVALIVVLVVLLLPVYVVFLSAAFYVGKIIAIRLLLQGQ